MYMNIYVQCIAYTHAHARTQAHTVCVMTHTVCDDTHRVWCVEDLNLRNEYLASVTSK